MPARLTLGRWVLLGMLALPGAVILLHRLSADPPGPVSRAGVGLCPAAGTAPMPVACVPRPPRP